MPPPASGHSPVNQLVSSSLHSEQKFVPQGILLLQTNGMAATCKEALSGAMTSIMLSHPTVKIPLLLANLICSQITMSPPTPIPKKDEREKYDADERSRETIQSWAGLYIPTLKMLTHIIALTEAILILAHSYPLLPFSTLVTNSALSRLRITPIFLLGSTLTYAAGLLRYQCYRTLGRHYTFQLAVLPHHKLVTSGPYAYVRHPGYTAGALVNLGITIYQLGSGSFLREIIINASAGSSWRSLVAPVWAVMLSAVGLVALARIPKEDLVLRKEFGEEWDRWAERTRYRLIPGIY